MNYSTYCNYPICQAPLLGPKTLSANEDLVQVVLDKLIRVVKKLLFEVVVWEWGPHIER
jgi:hypothetical protein